MQINKITNYYAPKTATYNKPMRANTISFGEHEWCGGMPDYQGMRNRKVASFFEEAERFKTMADKNVKRAKKLAQIAYEKGKEVDFEGDNGLIKIGNLTYDIRCRQDEKTKQVELGNYFETFILTFDKNSETMPKTYQAKSANVSRDYVLEVAPDEMTYYDGLGHDDAKKSIKYDKEGYTYTEREYEDSKDYKMAVVKKFPHRSKSQYIEYHSHDLTEDSRHVYSYDPKTRNWSCSCE